MRKVFFFDVDGTLMMHDPHVIPENTIKQLNRLKSLGYDLFIASGRPMAFISKHLKDIGFTGYVLCNGAHVEIDQQLIYEQPLQYDDVKSLITFLNDVDCEYDFETTTDCYIDSHFHSLNDFFQSCDINKQQLMSEFDQEEVMHRTLKIEISTSEGEKIENYIKDIFDYDSYGTKNAFEIYSPKVSKAVGIQKVIEYLNIPLETSYAFGDGSNDIEMLQYVGHGIAMGNSCQELKDVADEVIGSIDEDGLAIYLKTID